MYCGDETGSFIGEVASSSSRFGYGGEDNPKCVLPSYTYHDGTIPPASTNRCPPHLKSAGNGNGNDNDSYHDITPIFKPFPSAYSSNQEEGYANANGDEKGGINPDTFLQQSQGLIENYDAWENVWHKAFQQLHVASYKKHTKGGGRVQTQRIHTTTHSSGLTSSDIGNPVEGGDNVETEIMHPILAIDAGHTHPGGAPVGMGMSTGAGAGVGQQYQNCMVQKQKSKMIEILYESLSAPATFIAPSPMLASFANGRQTSLVVDIGAGGTRVTPIVDGLVLEQAQRRNGRGGEWLSNVQERVVEDLIKSGTSKNTGDTDTGNSLRTATISSIHPRYACKRDHSNGSISVQYPNERIKSSIFHRMAVSSIMYEMKTSPHVTGVDLFRNDDYTIPFMEEEDENGAGASNSKESGNGKGSVNGDGDAMDVDGENRKENGGDGEESTNADDDDYDTQSKKYFELPDGTRVELRKTQKAKDLCRLPELLFASELPYIDDSSQSSQSSTSSPSGHHRHHHHHHPTLSSLPLHELVKESLSAVADADVRKELCGNIILTGASSLYSNLEQRLSLEVQHLVPSTYKCKVIATKNTVERRFAPWIGGSVLSSLGSFQQLWLSKKEYEEFGMALATQRFP